MKVLLLTLGKCIQSLKSTNRVDAIQNKLIDNGVKLIKLVSSKALYQFSSVVFIYIPISIALKNYPGGVKMKITQKKPIVEKKKK